MKTRFVLIAVMCLITSLVIQIWLRDFFYRNKINEFGVLGSLPNFLSTFGSIAFVLSINKLRDNKMPLIILGLTTAGLYREFESWGKLEAGNGNTFDWGDIIATIIGGLLSYCLYLRYQKI